jgi:hypothetical protein
MRLVLTGAGRCGCAEQSVAVIWPQSGDFSTHNSKVLRDFCGTLLCSHVLDDCNGRLAHRFSLNLSPTESNS